MPRVTVFGFLSTYPPTRCGLATFTASLASAIALPGSPEARIVRVDDRVPTGAPVLGARTTVVGDLRPGLRSSRAAASAALSACDIVIVQHEYGIYGGRDGDEILDVLGRLTAPCIVVLHTVRESPTAHQRWLLDRIAGLAAVVVVMTSAARDLLNTRYTVPARKVRVIPHGVPEWPQTPHTDRGERPTVMTWGLLGPGKGIEWGIHALAAWSGTGPRPRYLIAGQTHPKVLAEAGEAYRESLIGLADFLGVGDDIEFDGQYHDAQELAALVASADVVLLPYDSREQTTSGVLVEALSAGKPVIATRFPHAVELLSAGAGILVEQQSSREIAAALRRVVNEPGLAAAMSAAALAESRAYGWDAVAAEYRGIAVELLRENAA